MSISSHETARAAFEYAAAGLSQIPLRLDGSKAPAGDVLPLELDETDGKRKPTWKPFQNRQPSRDELKRWHGGDARHGIGIVCGAVSRNLLVIDVDERRKFPELEILAEAYGMLDLLRSLPHVETPEGDHLYLRCQEPVGGNTVLARNPDNTVAIEARGQGGYAVAPGSPAAVHKTGRPYLLVPGSLDAIPVLTKGQMESLLDLCRMLTEYDPAADTDRPVPARSERKAADGLRPGDDFNERGDLLPILEAHGWRVVRSGGSNVFLARPGQDRRGWAAKLGTYGGRTLFTVYSSTAAVDGLAPNPGQQFSSHEPFTVYADLEHHGDYKAAAKALAALGYGDQTPQTPSTISDVLEDEEDGAEAEEPEAEYHATTENPLISRVTRRIREFADVEAMGLRIRSDISSEEHDELGRRLIGSRASTLCWLNFCLADWYLSMPDMRGYKKERVIALFGETMWQQVRNAAVVGSAWPLDVRRTDIRTWEFYRVTSRGYFTEAERAGYADRYVKIDRDERGALLAEIRGEAKRRHQIEDARHAPPADLELTAAPDPMGDIAKHERAETVALLDKLIALHGDKGAQALLRSLLAMEQPSQTVAVTLGHSIVEIRDAGAGDDPTDFLDGDGAPDEFPELTAALDAGDLDIPDPTACDAVPVTVAAAIRPLLNVVERMRDSSSPMQEESVRRAREKIARYADQYSRPRRAGVSP